MVGYDLNTGKLIGKEDAKSHLYMGFDPGKKKDYIINGWSYRPKTPKGEFLFYVALNAIKNIPRPKDVGSIIISIDSRNSKLTLNFRGYTVRAHMRLRIRTTDFKLVRVSVDSMHGKLNELSVEADMLAKVLKYINTILSKQKPMKLENYPYVPKYNEKGWKNK